MRLLRKVGADLVRHNPFHHRNGELVVLRAELGAQLLHTPIQTRKRLLIAHLAMCQPFGQWRQIPAPREDPDQGRDQLGIFRLGWEADVQRVVVPALEVDLLELLGLFAWAGKEGGRPKRESGGRALTRPWKGRPKHDETASLTD